MIARSLAVVSLAGLLALSSAAAAPERLPGDCEYRQVAVSLPLAGTSDGGEGHPWRLMYGYCLLQRGPFSLHQDWVLSYLDAKPIRGAEGGTGIGAGTDFALRWHVARRAAFSAYLELGNGIQYAAGTAFPAHGSRWTFTTNAGVGLLFPVQPEREISIAIRYLHMSNAGLFPDNAGYDALHLAMGMKFGR